MAEDFRDCFVGEKGYDALKKLMKIGNEFCTEIAKCLQERSDAEMVYTRALRKNSENLDKLAGKAKGTLFEAFDALAKGTDKECEAHSAIASVLLDDIAIPMKNLAEKQLKERRLIEDGLNEKFKEWNSKKDEDTKYRSRQFEKSKEIEELYLKITDSSTMRKSSSRTKGSTSSTPLVMSCVLPGGRHASTSEKSTSTSVAKCHANIELSLQKAERELEKVEIKYHNSTRNVELAREACDTEMRRSCDQMQKIELNRIDEMGKFIQTYTQSINTLSDTMYQISQDFRSIQVKPDNDVIVAARSNVQTPEIEILLYDIYAEDINNGMSEQRRIISLMHWRDILKMDIEAQQQSKHALSYKSAKKESSSDDQASSSDGAMCSKSSHSIKGIVLRTGRERDNSSASSTEDDGAMVHTKAKKREKKKNQSVERFSNEIHTDRRNISALQDLGLASYNKIASVYNRIKHLPEMQNEYAPNYTVTHTQKGYPTTLLRLPCQPSTHTPPSAPFISTGLATAMPTFPQPFIPQHPMMYTAMQQAPPPQWRLHETQVERAAPDDPMVASAPTYSFPMPQPRQVPQQNRDQYVRVIHPFNAKHKDELSLRPGDIIILLERRRDQWCKGNLNGIVGLFPGNYVQEVD